MKEQKTFFNIITIITNFLATIVFFLPTWYFVDAITMNGTTSILSSTSLRAYDYKALSDIQELYMSHGFELDLRLSVTIFVLIIVLIVLSLLFVVSTIIHNIKNNKKTRRIQSIISILILVISFVSLALSIVFASYSKVILAQDNTMSHTYSIGITTGIYVLIILELSGVFASYISNKIHI